MAATSANVRSRPGEALTASPVKGGNVVVLPARTPAAAPAPRSVPADARTAALEAENEGLRDENERLTGEVSKLRRALRHAANMIDALGGAPSGDVGVDS